MAVIHFNDRRCTAGNDQKIVARGCDLSAQVLKQPHHGYQDVRLQDKPKGRYVYDSGS